MTAVAQTPSVQASRNAGVWAGRVASGLVIAFLVMDAGMKLARLPIVEETGRAMGLPAGIGFPLGVLLAAITLLYAIPRTAVLGAVLLTGYLGGAICTHVLIGSPLFSHTLFGLYIGVLAWTGLWLRSPQLRALIPLAR